VTGLGTNTHTTMPTRTRSKTQTTQLPFTNCTASSPADPKAGLPKPKTKAAWRKAFWA